MLMLRTHINTMADTTRVIKAIKTTTTMISTTSKGLLVSTHHKVNLAEEATIPKKIQRLSVTSP